MEDPSKYGSLLANLQERVVQTDQGMVVLSSNMSPNSTVNTGLSLSSIPQHTVYVTMVFVECVV